jgi:hypothetical protein
VLKKITDVTHRSSLAKLGVLAIVVIPTIMTVSMHGVVLAVGEPGYQLTVKVSSYPFGTSTLGISITTENGYTDHADVATSGVTSWTFNIPTNQGSWVQVCVNSDNSSRQNCSTYNTTGTDMSVSLSPSSGNSDRYYVYPGNTYYIYPGYRHDYYHHDWEHGFGGHDYGGDHGYGGHHDTGNIGNGGNQNGGNIGNGGNQDHWFGGHHDTGNIGNGGNQNGGNIGNGGNHGATQPVNRLPHLSNGAPIMNAESSDDDSDFP